ncbi:succinic semialdehyde dehydrogenase [Halomicrococcus sp. NG-SE-24]|uniref:succinic semialdehyde dehydrogenase n=1 Tax=Halomicrococcus sp. NG-SE-24 TaxID=3436928 RepID=UPI003D983CD5
MTLWTDRVRPEITGALTGEVSLADDAVDARDVITVEAPFTGEEIGTVPAATEADVTAAAERARAAQAEWASRPLEQRADVLSRFHDLVLDRREELLDLVVIESGKVRRDAFEEILDVATNARYYGSRADEFLTTRRRHGAIPLLTRTEEHRHPRGVVGMISPWNYPLTLAVSDALPALVAGNAVVLKPAEETPFTALHVAQLLEAAGLPEDVFSVVTGRGSEVGPALIDRVDYVAFTGSTETGREVARRAGENLVDCSLELGGKNPMVVLADADLDRAVQGAVHGAFTNAGQLCISFERLYVEEPLHDRFLRRFAERTRELGLEAALDYGVEVGSLASSDQLEKVEAHLADAVEKGATVVTGGEARPDVGPYFFEPTVLTDVTPEMDLAREETFGPIVAVHRVADAEEAVERANDSAYGLNASVWTDDAERGRELAAGIDCGTVGVNDPYPAAWASVDAPMGGMGDSGLGRRHGREGILKYTQSQTVAEQRGPPIAPPDVPGVPRDVATRLYARTTTGLLRALKRLAEVR